MTLQENNKELDEIRTRLQVVQDTINKACQRSGRDPSEVRLIAVSKTVAAERVQAGIEAGITILGENYIQEARDKIELIGRPVSWHFIGRLQSNKAKYAARLFDMIHSVDNLKLARELDKKAGATGRRLEVLVQVNISGEETKGGAEAREAEALIEQVGGLDNLELKGLMTMPPFFDQPEKARPYFAALRKLREKNRPPLTGIIHGHVRGL